MKWDKGKSYEEKYNDWLNKKKDWNKWFAWYPVTMGNKRVWLELLERRGSVCWVSPESGNVGFEYEYRFIGATNE